jgi:hypothetical protein
MTFELGAMTIRRHSESHLELGIGWITSVVGWIGFVVALVAAFALAPVSHWLAAVACLAAALAIVVATARHSLGFDRSDGVVRIHRRVAGIGAQSVVPLFHLRAVTVRPRPSGRGYVAVLERRNGNPIIIDTRDRPGPLYDLVRSIAAVTDLRLIYDNTREA